MEAAESALAVALYSRHGDFIGGLRLGHQWGGRNADGSQKKAESLIVVVIGASVDLGAAK